MEEVQLDNDYQLETESCENESEKKNLCGCSSKSLGLLAAGVTELALGSVGLALIVLGPQNRHTILYPLEEYHKVKLYSEEWEDTIQLLIEYWLPALAYWILGAILIVAAVTTKQRMSLLFFWVFISTLLIAGSIAGILGLLVAGASIVGLLPLILATVAQMYFYVVISSDMTLFNNKINNPKAEDKEMLVVDSIV